MTDTPAPHPTIGSSPVAAFPERTPEGEVPAERIVLLTGHLAMARVDSVMASIGGLRADGARFLWQVIDVGVKVAALMTEDIIRRRVHLPEGTTLVVVPGRCRADLGALAAHFGVPVLRGPDEVVDLPQFFGRGARAPDLSDYSLRIFAEIVDAPDLDVAAVVARAERLVAAGADVVDIGCLPDTPFPHLADTVRALKAAGFKVSVDSASVDELRTGAHAGADFLLSLNEDTLDLARETAAVPILVPARPHDLDSLGRAVERMEAWGLPYLADPILDPIHFGFTRSLVRYQTFRDRYPQAPMLMGTGNLTELTEADTTGITATLLGICSELAIDNVLVVQVSPHTRRTIEEHDLARRIMHAAKRDAALPKSYSGGLAGLHDRRPFANTGPGVTAAAKEVKDRNFRIEVVEDGIHVYNRDIHEIATEALPLFPKLGVETDGGHAFYLGTELMKAEIAASLGKRYAQDEPLDFGVATPRAAEDLTRQKDAGHTLATRAAHRKGRGGASADETGEDAGAPSDDAPSDEVET